MMKFAVKSHAFQVLQHHLPQFFSLLIHEGQSLRHVTVTPLRYEYILLSSLTRGYT